MNDVINNHRCSPYCGNQPIPGPTGPTGPRGMTGATARCNKSSIYIFKW